MTECAQCRAGFSRKNKPVGFTYMSFVPSFETNEELAQHMTILHGEMGCLVCDFHFETRHARQRHMTKAHGLKASEIRELVSA